MLCLQSCRCFAHGTKHTEPEALLGPLAQLGLDTSSEVLQGSFPQWDLDHHPEVLQASAAHL